MGVRIAAWLIVAKEDSNTLSFYIFNYGVEYGAK